MPNEVESSESNNIYFPVLSILVNCSGRCILRPSFPMYTPFDTFFIIIIVIVAVHFNT